MGIKGQISELELHTMRNRIREGILSQADRGELALKLPVGLVRDVSGQVHKDPNLEIQKRIELIFSTFLELKSACKVARFFREHNILIPRRNNYGELYWRNATEDCIAMTLGNPAYAGAFAYGRTEMIPDPCKKNRKRLPIEEWKYLRKDKYPSYISWETFEQILGRLRENRSIYDFPNSSGITSATFLVRCPKSFAAKNGKLKF